MILRIIARVPSPRSMTPLHDAAWNNIGYHGVGFPTEELEALTPCALKGYLVECDGVRRAIPGKAAQGSLARLVCAVPSIYDRQRRAYAAPVVEGNVGTLAKARVRRACHDVAPHHRISKLEPRVHVPR